MSAYFWTYSFCVGQCGSFWLLYCGVIIRGCRTPYQGTSSCRPIEQLMGQKMPRNTKPHFISDLDLFIFYTSLCSRRTSVSFQNRLSHFYRANTPWLLTVKARAIHSSHKFCRLCTGAHQWDREGIWLDRCIRIRSGIECGDGPVSEEPFCRCEVILNARVDSVNFIRAPLESIIFTAVYERRVFSSLNIFI